MRYYSAIKRNKSTDTHYSLDETWKDAQQKKLKTKIHIFHDSSFQTILRTGQSRETESKLTDLPGAVGAGELGMLLMDRDSFLG